MNRLATDPSRHELARVLGWLNDERVAVAPIDGKAKTWKGRRPSVRKIQPGPISVPLAGLRASTRDRAKRNGQGVVLRFLEEEKARIPSRQLQLPIRLHAPLPRCRGECVDAPRPCPFVSCKHHLYLDIADDGSIKFNHPHLEVWELKESCALDLAEQGGMHLEEVGTHMNLTRERIRQHERAFARLMRPLIDPDYEKEKPMRPSRFAVVRTLPFDPWRSGKNSNAWNAHRCWEPDKRYVVELVDDEQDPEPVADEETVEAPDMRVDVESGRPRNYINGAKRRVPRLRLGRLSLRQLHEAAERLSIEQLFGVTSRDQVSFDPVTGATVIAELPAKKGNKAA